MKTMTKAELERLYNNNTNDECCRVLGVTKQTLISYLRAAGIELKGKGGGRGGRKVTII